MIGCQEAVRGLWGYLEDEVGLGDRRRLDEHLAFCRRCCGELEFARELRSLLRTKTSAVVPEDVRGRLEAVIDGLQAGGSGAHE